MTEDRGQDPQTERREKENEYRAKLSPQAAERLRTDLAEDDRRGIRENPFKLLHNPEKTAERVAQIYTGNQGALTRELKRGDEQIETYGHLDAAGKAAIFPQGLDPVYVSQLKLLERFKQLDVSHANIQREMQDIERAKIPKPTFEERLAALEAKLAPKESA